MNRKIRVALIMGGVSLEHDVSIMTAKNIKNNIKKDKYDIDEVVIPRNGSTDWVKKLIDGRYDLAMVALHGGTGENGSVQGLLECINLPYVGSKVLGSAIGMNKYLSKQIMRQYCIPVADDVCIRKDEDYSLFLNSIKAMGYPVVVKPNEGGSSIGITIVESDKDIKSAIDKVFTIEDEALIEKYIFGQEVTCGIFEENGSIHVMPVLDIGTSDGFYDYKAKYEDNRGKIEFSSLPLYLQKMIEEIAKTTFKCLRCKEYARVDMIIKEEQIYVLEINTLPGMTERSLIPKAIKVSGVEFCEFLDKLMSRVLK